MMETWTYSVVPVPGGWALEQPCGLPLMFLSGGRAESKAAELAKQAIARGGCAEVLIFDRGNSLLGRRRYLGYSAAQLAEAPVGEVEGEA
ncbi:hypothetical protein [Phenylobacterium sp. CCH9-H3]|uniref:hypothetical protein n=2 Tax=Phenylobacterium TaxID=20 RepID=UPI000839E0F0|nr:hypothetical protein [Phenylobacterium sp. CCH9-H3]